jgi:surface protein
LNLLCCFMWGVVVLFECCGALFAAFYLASDFNSDLSKWDTGKVTTMSHSKCTLLGVVFFPNKNRRTHTSSFIVELVVFFYVGMLSFSLNVVAHSLQRLCTHLPSIQTCPSGRRARSLLCNKVSVLFSVLFSFPKNKKNL